MSGEELPVLLRAHRLFETAQPGAGRGVVPPEVVRYADAIDRMTGALPGAYRLAASANSTALRSCRDTDARLAAILAGAQDGHRQARRLTADVVRQARLDGGGVPDTALAHREALRRRVARLRAQRAHVLRARRRAQRNRAALRALAYRRRMHRGARATGHRDRTEPVLRAALSRLGRPYVWAATGPDSFDCSGLTQWSYAQAGVHLDRTTYEQINQGIPVAPGQIRPGDLVFPSADHVQLAIGGNRVIEAPQPGGVVQISPLGPAVAIRRILP